MRFHRSRVATALALASLFVGLQVACSTNHHPSPTPPADITNTSTLEPKTYCTYRVVSVQGDEDCKAQFPTDALICVDCPGNASCPGPAGRSSTFRYLVNGAVRCTGVWAKRFDTEHPDSCLTCPDPPGKKGFEFVSH